MDIFAVLGIGPVLVSSILIVFYYLRLGYLKRHAAAGSQLEKYKRLWGRIIIICALLPLPLILACSLVNTFIVPPIAIKIMRRNADTLTEALDNFHARNGQYPEELAELVPYDLKKIPKLPEFKYELKEDWYHLSYGYVWFFYVICNYNSNSRGWICD